MAASMKVARISFLKKIVLERCIQRAKPTFFRSFSNALYKEDVVEYPPVKPKYPPGIWGDLEPKKAWEFEEEREYLLSQPTAKWRLERIAGPLPGKIKWLVPSVADQPGTLPYKQYITKTHLEKSLPDLYQKTVPEDADLQRLVDRVRPQVEDVILMENEYGVKNAASTVGLIDKSGTYYRQRVVRQIVDVLINNLCYDAPHLLEAQVDGEVSVQSFWFRVHCGSDKDTFGRYTYGDGRLWFQGHHKPSLQIRSEQPLPEFLSMDDVKCSGQVEDMKYSPPVFGMGHLRTRLFNISGHWQEDPCEFTLLSLNVSNVRFEKFVKRFGDRFCDEASTLYGLTGAFLSCAAQAHNQGFNWLMDMTYPITTQSIVTDGRWFQFMAYQLNTLRLWLKDDAFPLRNLCWTTERMSLYESIENGKIHGFNDEVLKLLLKFVIMEPLDRGINLRPYLPEEPAPAKRKERYMNFKGEEPIPFTEKPGQFEYPRNSAYFHQNI